MNLNSYNILSILNIEYCKEMNLNMEKRTGRHSSVK